MPSKDEPLAPDEPQPPRPSADRPAPEPDASEARPARRSPFRFPTTPPRLPGGLYGSMD
ncbi:MAG TPA: hypothetical protein VHG91_05765 [Longimicrobium sp.]|nr:hypothetical protein [Longimicrobium sp.]